MTDDSSLDFALMRPALDPIEKSGPAGADPAEVSETIEHALKSSFAEERIGVRLWKRDTPPHGVHGAGLVGNSAGGTVALARSVCPPSHVHQSRLVPARIIGTPGERSKTRDR